MKLLNFWPFKRKQAIKHTPYLKTTDHSREKDVKELFGVTTDNVQYYLQLKALKTKQAKIVLCLSAYGSQTVHTISQRTGLDKKTVSRHLGNLTHSGKVTSKPGAIVNDVKCNVYTLK